MVDDGKTLAFVLPAFPFKSTNHVEKVMGPQPDVGERLAIAKMHNFAEKVRNNGAPLVSVIIFYLFHTKSCPLSFSSFIHSSLLSLVPYIAR